MRIALATAPDVPASDQDEPVVARALEARGHDAPLVRWDDAGVDWAGFDAVLIRSTWDYIERVEEFQAWARAVEAAGTPLHNPAAVVGWNTHKGYLLDLEERGAPVVPTAWLGRGDRVALADVAADRGWPAVVAKPAVGAGSDGLVVVRAGEDPAAAQPALDALLARGDVLVQPFVASVADGELSLVVVDGRVSHAVRKVPAPGEARVQVEFGGRYLPEEPDRDTVRLAEWVVGATGHDLLYARVDLLADVDGTWLLNELEAVEPSLLLSWVPQAAERLVDALLERVAGSG